MNPFPSTEKEIGRVVPYPAEPVKKVLVPVKPKPVKVRKRWWDRH